MQCDWLVPDFDPEIGGLQCLLGKDHGGEHLVLRKANETALSLGIKEIDQYYLWQPDDSCGCGDPECEDYVYGEIPTEKALTLLEASPP